VRIFRIRMLGIKMTEDWNIGEKMKKTREMPRPLALTSITVHTKTLYVK